MYMPPNRIGGGQAGVNLWVPRLPPGVSEFWYREEFDRDELPAGWETNDSGIRISYNDYRKSWLLCQCPGSGVSRYIGLELPGSLPTNLLAIFHVRQNFTLTDPANDRYNCAVALGRTTGVVGQIISFSEIVLLDYARSVTNFGQFYVGRFQSTDGGPSQIKETTDNQQSDGKWAGQYLAIHKIGTTYHAWYASDPTQWQYFWSFVNTMTDVNRFGFRMINPANNPGPGIYGLGGIWMFETDKFPY
jgi:hypothetical protein